MYSASSRARPGTGPGRASAGICRFRSTRARRAATRPASTSIPAAERRLARLLPERAGRERRAAAAPLARLIPRSHRWTSSPTAQAPASCPDTPRRRPATTCRRSYQPPADYQQGGYPPPGYPPAPAYPPRRLPDTGLATAGLPAALPRPVGVRWPAGIRRPVLSPAAALRRRARVSAATAVVRRAGIPRRIRRGLRAAAVRNQPVGDLVAGGLADRDSLRDRSDSSASRSAWSRSTRSRRKRQGGHGLAVAGIAVGVAIADHQHHLVLVRAQRLNEHAARAAVPRCRVPAVGAVGAAAGSVCARRLSDGLSAAAAAGIPAGRRYPGRLPPAIRVISPYDPYRPGKPLGTNGKAIAALVTALAGLVFCGLPSIAGLILGIIAMREMQAHRPGRLRNRAGGHHHRRPDHRVGGALLRLHHRQSPPSGWQWAP